MTRIKGPGTPRSAPILFVLGVESNHIRPNHVPRVGGVGCAVTQQTSAHGFKQVVTEFGRAKGYGADGRDFLVDFVGRGTGGSPEVEDGLDDHAVGVITV